MIKQIIWDVDGTLYRSVPEFKAYFEKCYLGVLTSKFPNENPQVLWAKFIEERSKTGSATFALNKLTGRSFRDLGELFELAVPRAQYMRKDDKLLMLFQTLHDKGIKSYALRNGVTQGTKDILVLLGLDRLTFGGCEFGPFIKVLGVFDNFETSKPDPKPFRYFIEELHFTSRETLSIGDRVNVDLVAAKNLGMQTALIWKTPKEEEKQYVDFVLPDVYSVATLFE